MQRPPLVSSGIVRAALRAGIFVGDLVVVARRFSLAPCPKELNGFGVSVSGCRFQTAFDRLRTLSSSLSSGLLERPEDHRPDGGEVG